ncbi:MAG: DNA polymerase III subunit delta [Patescibacteria group bacterium]
MIIFLYGEDSFRSLQKLKELKSKFIRDIDPKSNSLTSLDGANINIGQINEKVGPNSLLSKKRMIIIDDIFLNKSKEIFTDLIYLIDKKKEDENDNIVIFRDSKIKTKMVGKKENALIIDSSGRNKNLTREPLKLFNFLSKQKYTQEFKLLSNTETANWVKKEVELRGGTISFGSVQLLVGLVGNDLWQLNNEINKLINYSQSLEQKLIKSKEKNIPVSIEAQNIEKLVRGKFDENIFALTDAISNKNKNLAVKLIEEQFAAGLADGYLINMIVRQFKILLQIREALDSGYTSRKIISLLKLHPFIVQKGINQVRNFGLPILKNSLAELIEIDFKMKTGQANTKVMLNLFLSKI